MGATTAQLAAMSAAVKDLKTLLANARASVLGTVFWLGDRSVAEAGVNNAALQLQYLEGELWGDVEHGRKPYSDWVTIAEAVHKALVDTLGYSDEWGLSGSLWKVAKELPGAAIKTTKWAGEVVGAPVSGLLGASPVTVVVVLIVGVLALTLFAKTTGARVG